MPEEGDATVDIWRRTVDLPGRTMVPLTSTAAPPESPTSSGSPMSSRPSASLSELADVADLLDVGSAARRGEAEDPLAGLLSAVIPIASSPEVGRDRLMPPLPPVPEEIPRQRGGWEMAEDPAEPDSQPEKEMSRFRLLPTGSLLFTFVEGAASRSATVLVRYLFALLLLLVLAIFFIAYLAWR